MRDYAQDLRDARLAAGLTQRRVGMAAGLSKSAVSRIESGRGRGPTLWAATRLAQVVGLDLNLKCYPSGLRLRDAGHVALLHRFLAQVHPSVRRRLEAPIPIDRDQRAWDLLLQIGPTAIGVAAETRLTDLQALLRREQAKQRDGHVDRLLLLVADTRANRRVIGEVSRVLSQQGFVGTRRMMRAVRDGRDPEHSGWALV